MITEDEIRRYKRQLAITGWDIRIQEKLKDSSVFVAGAGGLGSPVLYYLAAAGVGKIIICDRDRIEESNLNRQILYNSEDKGKWKAETARNRLALLNDSISVEYFNTEADSKLYNEISRCNLIIDCLDNFESRHEMNSISVKTGVPMIHAGVSEYYGQVTFLHPGETPCLACFLSYRTPANSGGIIGSVAGVTGSIQATEAIKYLGGSGELLKNRLLHIDLRSMYFTETKISRNPQCKVCH